MDSSETGLTEAAGDHDPADRVPPSTTAERAAPHAAAGALAILLGLGLLSALVFLVVVTLGSGDSSRRSSPPVSALPAPPPPPTAKPLTLVPIAAAGRSGSGTGEIGARGAVRLSIRGLAPGRYEVWAFNSIRQARSLATFSGPAATIRGTMPSGRFRFVDVSREPDDGNPAHSGQSVLRAQL